MPWLLEESKPRTERSATGISLAELTSITQPIDLEEIEGILKINFTVT